MLAWKPSLTHTNMENRQIVHHDDDNDSEKNDQSMFIFIMYNMKLCHKNLVSVLISFFIVTLH